MPGSAVAGLTKPAKAGIPQRKIDRLQPYPSVESDGKCPLRWINSRHSENVYASTREMLRRPKRKKIRELRDPGALHVVAGEPKSEPKATAERPETVTRGQGFPHSLCVASPGRRRLTSRGFLCGVRPRCLCSTR